MKNSCLLLLFALLVFPKTYARERTVVLEWKFAGIEEGYDHLNRCRIFVDDIELPVSGECKESEPGTYSLRLSSKAHRVWLVNEAYYEGNWMEHTFKNGFSMDAVCEFTLDAKEVAKVQVLFDLDHAGVSVTRFDSKGREYAGKPVVFKGKHYPLMVSWKFVNVEKGYDHSSRMKVSVDGVELGTSPQSVESKGGFFVVRIPKGKHVVRIVNQALFNGKWQDHSIVNNYSVEAIYEKALEIRKEVKVTLVIDLNHEHTVNTWE